MAFPENLGEFIGNKNATKILKLLISNYQNYGTLLPNVILHGKPGLGKSLLVSLYSKELGGRFYSTIGEQLDRELLFKTMEVISPYSCFFIDEIHSISKETSEYLYPVLQDKKLYLDTGIQDLSSKHIWIFGATTEFGSLQKPLRDRFNYALFLESYSPEEIIEIAVHFCYELHIEFDTEIFNKLPTLCQGTPRILKRIICACQDFMLFYKHKYLDMTLLKLVLATLGISEEGLTKQQQIYIKYLQDTKIMVGISSIVSSLGFNATDIELNIEPFLLEKKYVTRTPRGRALTEAGLNLKIEL